MQRITESMLCFKYSTWCMRAHWHRPVSTDVQMEPEIPSKNMKIHEDNRTLPLCQWKTFQFWMRTHNCRIMCKSAQTHDFWPCVCASLQQKKEPFEWLSNSWELQHEQHWLMQQKFSSVLGAGDVVVFPVYLIWVPLAQWRSEKQHCICQMALQLFDSTLWDDDWIQVDISHFL